MYGVVVTFGCLGKHCDAMDGIVGPGVKAWVFSLLWPLVIWSLHCFDPSFLHMQNKGVGDTWAFETHHLWWRWVTLPAFAFVSCQSLQTRNHTDQTTARPQRDTWHQNYSQPRLVVISETQPWVQAPEMCREMPPLPSEVKATHSFKKGRINFFLE